MSFFPESFFYPQFPVGPLMASQPAQVLYSKSFRPKTAIIKNTVRLLYESKYRVQQWRHNTGAAQGGLERGPETCLKLHGQEQADIESLIMTRSRQCWQQHQPKYGSAALACLATACLPYSSSHKNAPLPIINKEF